MSDSVNSILTKRNPFKNMSQVSAQIEIVNNIAQEDVAPVKTSKVAKKKSLHIRDECSINDSPVIMSTESLKTEGKAKPQDIIVIENIEKEMKVIDEYIEEYGSTFDTMRMIDSELTTKLVRQLVGSLFQQHYEEGIKNATGNKKYNLVQDVLTGSAELNKALSGLTKFDADQEFLLNDIDQNEVAEFIEQHKELAELLKNDFSHDDLFIKAKILQAISFFIKYPISDVLDDAENGNDALIKAHPKYIPFIKKATPKSNTDYNQMDKNCASLNAEYSLAYITLSQMISLFDEYTVKRLTKEIKAYQVAYIEKYLPEEIMDDKEALTALVDAIGTEDSDSLAITIRLLTILIDKEALQKIAHLDKKLEEKLKNSKSKWPSKFNAKAFEREYSTWMLKQDPIYNAMEFEHQIAVKASAMSKRFVIDGSAGDITKKEDSVDKIIYTLQDKFENYRMFLLTELADQPQGTYTTFCGRIVTQAKSKHRGIYDKIDPLTDVQLLLCTKHVAEEEAEKVASDEAEGIITEEQVESDVEDDDDADEVPEVADTEVPKKKKIEQSKSLPSYGTYIRKLYKNAIKSYKFTFSVTDEAFVNMICHIVRDTVNMYTCLAVDSYNNFVESEIYNTKFGHYADLYKDTDGDSEDTDNFVKQMSYYINGKIELEELPDYIPMLLDLHEAFNEHMRTEITPHPSTFYNTSCPIAAADINKYKIKASYHYDLEKNRYSSINDVVEEEEEEEEEEDNEEYEHKHEQVVEVKTVPKNKPKKTHSLQSFEKIFRNYYKTSTPKPKNKHTTNFLANLSMVVSYIVSLRLTWLGKLITFSSNEKEQPYYSLDDRKNYTAIIVQQFIESVSSSASSNKAFKESIFNHLKEIKNKLDKNKADLEELIRIDMDKLRGHSLKALSANEDMKENKLSKLNKVKQGTIVSCEKPPAITTQEKKIIASHSFASNFIVDRIKSYPIESKNIPFFEKKIMSLYNYADDLSTDNMSNFEINKEEHTQMIWSYPVKPYTNNNSIIIIGATLQRSLLSIVENALTTQFHATSAKKNVVHSETISSVLNLMGAGNIW